MKSIREILSDSKYFRMTKALSLAEYLQIPALSGSAMTAISMKHLRSSYEEEQPTTDAMIKGSAADALLFDYIVPTVREGGTVVEGIARWDDKWPVFGGTRRGKKWEEFFEQHGENYIRTFGERQDIVSMVSAIATDPVATPYWNNGISQATLTVVENGIAMKGRPDWVAPSAIVDMKTTGRIDSRSLSQTTFSLGYHFKMALYRRWWKQVTGEDKDAVLIFVEATSPYDVVVMPLDHATLAMAETKALRIIDKVRKCIEDDHWPGVAGGEPMPLEVPSWEMEEPQWVGAEVMEVTDG